MAEELKAQQLIDYLSSQHSQSEFTKLNRRIPFSQYIGEAIENPGLAVLAPERIYKMIMSHGFETYEVLGEKKIRYNFFKDELFGIDDALMDLVDHFKSAAARQDTRKRIILLHGPVSGAKSTIAAMIKAGLEEYSKTDEGALYSLCWEDSEGNFSICERHDQPLRLLPRSERKHIFKQYGIYIEGAACPKCRKKLKELERKVNGDLSQIYKNVYAQRICISEDDRIGVGTFQPADRKTQDMAELYGGVDFKNLGRYGAESDPDAWRFDGELFKAERGLMEWIEILKSDERFLYIALTLSQERKIKVPRFPLIDADLVLLGHTNETEFNAFVSSKSQEALQDRTIKIDVKYNLNVDDEVRIYEKLLSQEAKDVKKHVAPHALAVAAMEGVLSRYEDSSKATKVQKMKLYRGETIEDFKDKHIRELRKESPREGMFGLSPRSIVNVIANSVIQDNVKCLTPFVVLSRLHSALEKNSFPKISEKEKQDCLELIDHVRKVFNEVAKEEVLKAFLASYESAMESLCANYIDHVEAYQAKTPLKDPITGMEVEADESLMRSIEERIDNVGESRKAQFRSSLLATIASMMRRGEKFTYKSDNRLRLAIEKKVFEENRGNIKITTMENARQDDENMKKLEAIKTRLIQQYHYCDHCSVDLMNYVGGLLARGDIEF